MHKSYNTPEMEYRVILPKHDNSGNPIRFDELSKYVNEMANRFCGCTVIPTVLGCEVVEETLGCEENIIVTLARDYDALCDSIKDEYKILKDVLPTDRQRADIAIDDVTFLNDISKRAGDEFGQGVIFKFEDAVAVTAVPGTRLLSISPTLTGTKGRDWFARLL